MDRETKRQMRKYQNTLHICGMTVIIFGLWGVAKTVLSLIFSDQIREALFGTDFNLVQRIILYIILASCVGIDFLIRFYVGRSAMAEARGKKKRSFYIIVAFFILIFSILSFGYIYIALYYESDFSSEMDVIISGIVELTCCYNLLELLYTAIRLRKLGKKMPE